MFDLMINYPKEMLVMLATQLTRGLESNTHLSFFAIFIDVPILFIVFTLSALS